jgi:hypothetical protein
VTVDGVAPRSSVHSWANEQKERRKIKWVYLHNPMGWIGMSSNILSLNSQGSTGVAQRYSIDCGDK